MARKQVNLVPRKNRDRCDICDGWRGGIRGNENIIHGVIMCDYCTVSFQNIEKFFDVTRKQSPVFLQQYGSQEEQK